MAGRIVVLISGSGSNMEALAEACERREVPGDIVAVVADRDCPGLARAGRRGIETHVVDFKAYPSREEWSEALRDVVMKFDPDIVIHAGFMRIISPVYVDAFPGKLINLHPSLLPAFPGAHGVHDALAHGAKVTGSTIHFIDYEVDHGPIILQEAVRIEQNDTEESLHERIKAVEHRLLPQACRLVLDGKVRIEEGRVVVDQS
ncbi:MAG: phosphoribosylglycinamide formyltransferase [Actinomycetota bacterium]